MPDSLIVRVTAALHDDTPLVEGDDDELLFRILHAAAAGHDVELSPYVALRLGLPLPSPVGERAERAAVSPPG